MKTKFVIVLSTVAGLSGCAGFDDLKSEEVRDLSLVRFGDVVPANQDFILHFPAGQAIPTVFQIQGNLLERYAAVFFALEPIEKADLSTVHQFWRKVRPGFLKQILSRFTS